MLKSEVLQLMATLLSSIIGQKRFEQQSNEFKEMAIAGAKFLDVLEKQAKLPLENDLDPVTVWLPEDCQALFALIEALQATQATECPIV